MIAVADSINGLDMVLARPRQHNHRGRRGSGAAAYGRRQLSSLGALHRLFDPRHLCLQLVIDRSRVDETFWLDNERVLSVIVQLFADGIILGPGSDCTVVGNIGLLAVGIVGLSLGVELVLLVAALQTLGEVALAADAGPKT